MASIFDSLGMLDVGGFMRKIYLGRSSELLGQMFFFCEKGGHNPNLLVILNGIVITPLMGIKYIYLYLYMSILIPSVYIHIIPVTKLGL